ncbi:MAG TPA: hypothetical protein VK187_14005, partial [Geobacteraceae bacterium]|nr:hypothetical protein [Geobacteraceae bacterium]
MPTDTISREVDTQYRVGVQTGAIGTDFLRGYGGLRSNRVLVKIIAEQASSPTQNSPASQKRSGAVAIKFPAAT